MTDYSFYIMALTLLAAIIFAIFNGPDEKVREQAKALKEIGRQSDTKEQHGKCDSD